MDELLAVSELKLINTLNVEGITTKKPTIKRFIEFDQKKKNGELMVKVEFESAKRKPFLNALEYITDPRLQEKVHKLHKSKKLRKQREAVDKLHALIQDIKSINRKCPVCWCHIEDDNLVTFICLPSFRLCPAKHSWCTSCHIRNSSETNADVFNGYGKRNVFNNTDCESCNVDRDSEPVRYGKYVKL